jgi:hypothetical protein
MIAAHESVAQSNLSISPVPAHMPCNPKSEITAQLQYARVSGACLVVAIPEVEVSR